jgi:hypothetical protein
MTLCAEWWALPLAAVGGWVVINVALTSAVVLMAYLTNPTLLEAIIELEDYSLKATTEIDNARLLRNSRRAQHDADDEAESEDGVSGHSS